MYNFPNLVNERAKIQDILFFRIIWWRINFIFFNINNKKILKVCYPDPWSSTIQSYFTCHVTWTKNYIILHYYTMYIFYTHFSQLKFFIFTLFCKFFVVAILVSTFLNSKSLKRVKVFETLVIIFTKTYVEMLAFILFTAKFSDGLWEEFLLKFCSVLYKLSNFLDQLKYLGLKKIEILKSIFHQRG